MSSLSVNVGLDYHQNSIQACALRSDGVVLTNRRVGSSVAEVVSAVGGHGPVQAVAIESCGGAAEFGEALRAETGWAVQLAHPGYVNRMKLNPDKSDYGDARILADLSRAGYVPEVWLAPREIRELRTLVRRRQQCVNDRKATKLRLLALLRVRRIKAPKEVGGTWSQRWLSWLDEVEMSENDRWAIEEMRSDLEHWSERIVRSERRLTQVTRNDPVVARLMMLPGIGRVTAWVMRAEIADFGRFGCGKQLARFCGTTPRNCSSGERVADSGLIRAGAADLKMVIFQAAHRLLRQHARWSAFGAKLKRAGKPKNVIVAAVANRWIRSLFHDMKEMQAG